MFRTKCSISRESMWDDAHWHKPVDPILWWSGPHKLVSMGLWQCGNLTKYCIEFCSIPSQYIPDNMPVFYLVLKQSYLLCSSCYILILVCLTRQALIVGFLELFVAQPFKAEFKCNKLLSKGWCFFNSWLWARPE